MPEGTRHGLLLPLRSYRILCGPGKDPWINSDGFPNIMHHGDLHNILVLMVVSLLFANVLFLLYFD